jgi:hypothetical protein
MTKIRKIMAGYRRIRQHDWLAEAFQDELSSSRSAYEPRHKKRLITSRTIEA